MGREEEMGQTASDAIRFAGSDGAFASVWLCPRHFRFSPESRHSSQGSACLKGAPCRQVAPDTRPIAARVEAGLTSVRILNSEAARSRCVAIRNATAGGGATSVHQRLIDERLEHLAVIGAYRTRRLCHVDTDDLFLGIYPEKRARVTSPHELARGAGNASNPVALAHCKAKAECIARRSQQKLTRLERCCDARAEMV